ncbi:MAG: hypothetical protein M0007_03550 [Actinomycetota bacterium]|nr:hypothetical protein [Actinomycetota bacterium]
MTCDPAMSPDEDTLPIDRLSWEVAEPIGGGLLVAALASTTVSIASGVAFAFAAIPDDMSTIGPSIAEITQRLTEWATPVGALIALAAVGVSLLCRRTTA